MSADLYRVVLDDGSVREAPCAREGRLWRVDGSEGLDRDPFAAVTRYAASYDWPVREILAPGEVTRDEAIAAAVKAEREGCKAAVRDAAAVDDHGLPWCNCLDAINAREVPDA